MTVTKDRPRVVWINIDSLRPEVIYNLLDEGKLPNLGKMFGRGLRAPSAVGVFPSLTLPSQASLITGVYPGRHLITGDVWYDRYGKRPTYRDYRNSDTALQLYGYRLWGFPTGLLPGVPEPALGDNDISGATPTVYMAVKSRSVRTAVSFTQFSRGASEWLRPHRTDVLQYRLCQAGRLSFGGVDRTVIRRTVNFIYDVKHLHRLLHIYLPGLDGHCHEHGPAAQEKYLREQLDPALGRLLHALGDRYSMERYYFVLTSDHGQAAIPRDSSCAIGLEAVSGIMATMNLDCYKPGVRKNPKRVSVIAAPQGGSLHLYIKNLESGHWYDTPRLQQDLLEVAKKLVETNEKETAGVPPGWIDLLLVSDRNRGTYLVIKGKKVYEPEKFFLKGNAKKYPNAAARLTGLQSRRSADIIILPDYERGFHFGKASDRGQHGNLCADDSISSMIFAGPGIAPGYFPEDTTLLDVSPTLASFYKIGMQNTDGKERALFS